MVVAYIMLVNLYALLGFHLTAIVIFEGLLSLFWFSGSLAMGVWVRASVPIAAVVFGFLFNIIFLCFFLYDLVHLRRSRKRPFPY